MAKRRGPRTDFGTIVLHWAMVPFLIVLILTGLRIASDEVSLRWLQRFDAILPRDDLWSWHFIAALSFTAVFVAYVVYIVAAHLTDRLRLDVSRLTAIFRRGKSRWAAVGSLVLWMFFGAVAVELGSGVLLFIGAGGWSAILHRHAVWVCLLFPILHVTFHFAYGGIQQLARIFRPARMEVAPVEPNVMEVLAEQVLIVEALRKGQDAPGTKSSPENAAPHRLRPIGMAAFALACVVCAGLGLQYLTAIRLQVVRVDQPPKLDGDLSDAAWATAPKIAVLTDQGANFGGTGESTVEIRAVHDRVRVYFAFTWEDPTRSYKYLPLQKTADGWKLLRTSDNLATEDRLMEDKFSVLLAAPGVPFLGAAIHLAASSPDGRASSGSGRGLHFTQAGSLVDVWLWRVDHGGLVGSIDDGYFGPAMAPTEKQILGKVRYSGGYGVDDGPECFEDNFIPLADTPNVEHIVPRFLPTDLARMQAAMGVVAPSPEISESDGARWWLEADEMKPYGKSADDAIPIGTVIPSVVMTCVPNGNRADVSAVARWSAGRWTLEASRLLDTASPGDVPIVTGTMMWVSAFDHASTRHTRHIRAIALILSP